MAAKRVEYAIELLLGAKKRSNFDSTVSGVSSGIDSIGGVAKKVAAGITAAFAAVNVKDAIADAMETYTGFEQKTANTAAIAGASKTEYDKLEKAARDAGAATTKTAEESSEVGVHGTRRLECQRFYSGLDAGFEIVRIGTA